METIHRKTSRKTQVRMGRRCQERPEEDETHKMDRTSPRSPQMERNCWEGQDSTRVVAPSTKTRRGSCCLDWSFNNVPSKYKWDSWPASLGVSWNLVVKIWTKEYSNYDPANVLLKANWRKLIQSLRITVQSKPCRLSEWRG